MNACQFRAVSYGLVTENKKLGDNTIKVTPVEMTPFVDGELRSQPEKLVAKGVDADGISYELEVTHDTSITAHWLPRSGNRQTAPDVRRGQRVRLYQFGDTDKYYWEYLGLDDPLFRLETIIIAINNNPVTESDDTLDLSNCYYLEVSTHAQHITFKTCKSNQEPFEYTVQLDTKNGQFVLTDDADNHLLLNSRDRHIRMHNHDGTWVEVNKKNINAYAPDSVNVKAEKDVTVICDKMTIKAKSKVVISTPLVDISNNVKVGGNLDVGGAFKAGGGGEFGGAIKCAGVQSSLPVSAPNI